MNNALNKTNSWVLFHMSYPSQDLQTPNNRHYYHNYPYPP